MMIGHSNNGVPAVYQGRKGDVWEGATYAFTIYRNNSLHGTGLSNKSIRTIYEDKSEQHWIGTFNHGRLESVNADHNPDCLAYNDGGLQKLKTGGFPWV